MSQQGDEIVRQVLKTDPRPLSFAESLTYALQHGKSGRGAARLLGVSESTVRRWRGGVTPKPANRSRVEGKVRDLRTRPSTMGDAGVILHVTSRDRKRGSRDRDISGRQLRLAPGTVAATKETWIRTGDADAAAKVFLAGIGEEWYRRELSKGFMRSARDAGEGAAGGGGTATGGTGDIPDEGDDYYDEGLESDYGMSFG